LQQSISMVSSTRDKRQSDAHALNKKTYAVIINVPTSDRELRQKHHRHATRLGRRHQTDKAHILMLPSSPGFTRSLQETQCYTYPLISSSSRRHEWQKTITSEKPVSFHLPQSSPALKHGDKTGASYAH